MPIPKNPKRGEIWYVTFDPTIGAEIQKNRPAIIISIPELNALPLRIVVPITEYKQKHDEYFWYITIPKGKGTGLTKDSSANALQCKSVSIQRFTKKIGVIPKDQLHRIIESISECIGC